MFSKPLSLFLVFVISACNLVFMISPLLLLGAPFIEIHGNFISIDDDILQKLFFIFWLAIFLVLSTMSLYLFIDFLFAFSMQASLRKCTRFEKIKDYDFLSDIFRQVKEKFNYSSVKLYIKDSDQINAFAVGSLGRGAIVLTKGIVNHYLVLSQNPKIFLYCLRSVISHEMSHLVNKDFLPSFVIITNQKITNFFSKIVQRIFEMLIGSIELIPFIGKMSSAVLKVCNFVMLRFLLFFNQYVVFAVCEFLRRFVSRSTEFRCDNQAGKAFGGKYMANALEMLGNSGYFTLFSTHPSTKARVQKVAEVKIVDHVILPKLTDSLANGLSFIFLFFLLIYSAKMAKIDLILREILINHDEIYHKLSVLWRLIQRIY